MARFGFCLVILSVLGMSVLPFSEPRTSHQFETAFLVKLPGGCSGTLIAPNWVLTSAHCFTGGGKTPNNLGDYVYSGSIAASTTITRFSAHSLLFIWTSSIILPRPSHIKFEVPRERHWSQPVGSGNTSSSLWRRSAVRVIVHSGFQSEALSWKGLDLALIELEPADGDDGQAIPACVAAPGFSQVLSSTGAPLFVAGFGRRLLPHCLTDDRGPEKFAVCGRPVACSKDHRTRR